MKSIYSYLNYRDFLYDFYTEKKCKNSSFSYRLWADKSGFKSKSFIVHLIDGKKNLSKESAEKLNRVIGLSKRKYEYFLDLISFNQAKSIEERNIFFQKICRYNRSSMFKLLLYQQYEVFSRWYNWTIRELVCHVNFNEDYGYLGSLCRPTVSAREVRKSIKLLLGLGIIKKKDDGYVQTDSVLTTGDEVRSLAVTNFHLQNLNLAGESIETVSPQERDISSLVLALSDEGFVRIKRELSEFRKRLLAISNEEKGTKRVYHINFQLFPTTSDFNDKGGQM